MWIIILLAKLGFSPSTSATLWCDSVNAIYLYSNLVFHACTKHVEIDYHFIHNQIRRGLIHVRFIKSQDQIVDIITKPLG